MGNPKMYVLLGSISYTRYKGAYLWSSRDVDVAGEIGETQPVVGAARADESSVFRVGRNHSDATFFPPRLVYPSEMIESITYRSSRRLSYCSEQLARRLVLALQTRTRPQ
jgi:hypothetical protein